MGRQLRTLYHFFMKRITLIFMIISFKTLCCENSYPEKGPFDLNNKISKDNSIVDSLNVVTYNTAIDTFWSLIKKDFREIKKLRNADIILLQEITSDPIDSNKNNVRELANILRLNYIYAPAIIRNEKHNYGNAILSRFPFYKIQKTLLPESPKENCNQRIMLSASVEINKKEYRLNSIHLSTRFDESKYPNRYEQLLVAIDEARFYPRSIIAGDFNTFVAKERDQIITNLDNKNFSRVPLNKSTYRFTWWILDHIFYKGIEGSQQEIIRTAKGSDHFPLWATFKIN